MDEPALWSQVVRQPGAVTIAGFHPVLVPELGNTAPDPPVRAGVRLLVTPVDGIPNTATIDVTSTAVIAMLDGFLANGVHVGKVLTWRSLGFSSRRRDTLRITPAR